MEILGRRRPGANASEEAKLVAAYAQLVIAAELVACAGPLGGPQGGQPPIHVAHQFGGNLGPGNGQIVPYREPAPAVQPPVQAPPGPAVHVHDLQRLPRQQLTWWQQFLIAVRAWRWASALLLLLAPIWTVVLPKLIVFLVGRVFSRILEGVLKGAVLATEQALDETECAVKRLASSAVDKVITGSETTPGYNLSSQEGEVVPSWFWIGGLWVLNRFVTVRYGGGGDL